MTPFETMDRQAALDQSLRVLHCRQSERMWGPDRQILQLARHLPEFGISFELVLLRRWGLDAEPHPLAAQVRAAGGRATEVSARPQDWPHVVRLLRERLQHNDLLHTHEFKGDLLGWSAARSSMKPWLATDHHLATDNALMLRLFGYADYWALRHADAVVVPSQDQAQRLSGIDPDRLHVIRHGIDAEAFARAAGTERVALRSRHDLEPNQPLISLFGRLELVKGHSDLLEAAVIILQTKPNARFWIIGEGSQDEALRRQARALNVLHAVRFLGYQHDVAPYMAASDLILMPSHHESFGMVLIEAMSLAKPIVASAAGGIPEVVLDGAHGYLTPPGNPVQLSERVLQMLADPDRASELGRAALARVSQMFTVGGMVRQMVDLYRKLHVTHSTSSKLRSLWRYALPIS